MPVTWKLLTTATPLALATALLLAPAGITAAADDGEAARDNPAVEQRLVDAPLARPYRLWPSDVPADAPFERSQELVEIGFTGRHANYTGADTWYPSWASDGHMYSPFTDGTVHNLHSWSQGEKATTGHARIVGDDPMNLRIDNAGLHAASSLPYGGRYPGGSLVHNGVWYYGTYCLNETQGLNWDILGPFVGFRWSTDFGRTWTDTPHTPAKPIFPEPDPRTGKVRLGAPHFVDFGRNMEHSPDGKAYLVAHGSDGTLGEVPVADSSWITGHQVFLVRVTPSIETINDPAAYEFFAGHDDADEAIWTSQFEQMKPIAEWFDNMGCVTITYNAPLGKYLMCVTDGGNTIGKYNTYILESDRITGPWRMVKYMRHFGAQAYFVNIPSKFISADGRNMWLCYSANFWHRGNRSWRVDPPGSAYSMSLHEIRLLSGDDPLPDDVLHDPANIARFATVTASSLFPRHHAAAAVDGIVDGFPGNWLREWASHGERDTAVLRLQWDEPHTVDRVLLFDRPNDIDQVLGGMLIFSDGSTVPVGELPDDGWQGLELRFAPRTVRWMIFAITEVKAGTQNSGVAEIAVFRSNEAQQ